MFENTRVSAVAAQRNKQQSEVLPIPRFALAMSRLDMLVKGSLPDAYNHSVHGAGNSGNDPLASLPSSPPQIYLNLLILEASLRAQYLALRNRRRQNAFFILLLALWIAYFGYALFLRPREDGRGVGGSVYWVVETAEKVALMAGVVTGILIWGTGQWERGVRWPRRWLSVANRGLRGINAKIVIVRGPWWREALAVLTFFFPLASLVGVSTVSVVHHVEHGHGHNRHGHGRPRRTSTMSRTDYNYNLEDESDMLSAVPGLAPDPTASMTYEEDLTPGGDHIKLLLLPKAFSPAFREEWEQYRTDYWEHENERRAALRRRLRNRARARARDEYPWTWWLPFVGRGGSSPPSMSGGGRKKAVPSPRTPAPTATPGSSRPSSSRADRQFQLHQPSLSYSLPSSQVQPSRHNHLHTPSFDPTSLHPFRGGSRDRLPRRPGTGDSSNTTNSNSNSNSHSRNSSRSTTPNRASDAGADADIEPEPEPEADDGGSAVALDTNSGPGPDMIDDSGSVPSSPPSPSPSLSPQHRSRHRRRSSESMTSTSASAASAGLTTSSNSGRGRRRRRGSSGGHSGDGLSEKEQEERKGEKKKEERTSLEVLKDLADEPPKRQPRDPAMATETNGRAEEG